ncbi:MAG: hypothetical protein ACXAE3_05195 [Candidatus Kariarchaeaceae archaeon]|jgi:hypothetical protein
MSSGLDQSKESYLYIGVNPRKIKQDIISTFTGQGLVPISWYFLFSPEDVRIRREIMPDQIQQHTQDDLTSFEEFVEEPVAFRSTLPDAKTRLAAYKRAFSPIPYLWSYFKVIEILDKEIEDYIYQLENEPGQLIMHRQTNHPETRLSQVKIDGGRPEEPAAIDMDNPFAGLEDLGAEIEAAAGPVEPSSASDELAAFSSDDLLSALADAADLDFGDSDVAPVRDDPFAEEISFDVDESYEDDEEDFMPIVVYFDQLASDNKGDRISRLPLLLERLMHHAEREGEMTRVMHDLLQEIFRDAMSGYRVTGQLAEDFVQSNPTRLPGIMLGEPSPYVIIDQKLDLEYWASGTLQSGDERLMYTLTMLPTEQVHIAIQSGTLSDVIDDIGNLMSNTQNLKFKRLSVPLLKQPPLESNIWGFRVLIPEEGGVLKPATLLISDPIQSWREEFESKLKLPGVLEDWHIDLSVRYTEYSDIDTYQLVFEGAKDIDETFEGFVRWARRHHIMYKQRFGVNGTILRLKSILEETNDKQEGQQIFDILTKLTELGFEPAIDALSDDAIVRKLPWLYS